MRRNVIFALLTVSVLVAVSAMVITMARHGWRTSPLQSTAQDLAAPLALESATDLAAAMPAIDELRHRRGSVLDGTLLESAPEAEMPNDNSYVELLRREARRLDGIAADFEDQQLYDRADATRGEAVSLRRLAREKADKTEPLIQYGSLGGNTASGNAVNR